MALQGPFVSPIVPHDHASSALVRKESVESVRELIDIPPRSSAFSATTCGCLGFRPKRVMLGGHLPNQMSLRSKLLLRVCVGVTITIALVFIPAGSWTFWQGWVFLAIVFACGVFSSFYLYKHDPKLVERRLQTKEKIREQKLLIRLLRPLFVVVLALPGLDYRFGWSRTYFGVVPPWLVLLSGAFVLASFLFVIWVFRVNSFASRTIQVESGQSVISTGPYRVVRHPMYFGSVVMLLFTPLALGSYLAMPAFALLIPFYVLRLLNEEKVLRQELPGYSEYCLRTRFHLVPFVW